MHSFISAEGSGSKMHDFKTTLRAILDTSSVDVGEKLFSWHFSDGESKVRPNSIP